MSVITGILATVAVTPVVALSGMAATSAISIFENLPDHLDPGTLAKPSSILAKNSDDVTITLAEFFAQNREMVGWDQISQYVKDAAVSIEDTRFYTHAGVDIISVGRATLGQLRNRDGGGASTITMQYVRNVLVQRAEAILDPEKRDEAYEDAMRQDPDRKLQEMRYAVSIEKRYPKNEILLGYLNIALFGRNVYGIESAARTYFSKSALELTLSESASLIAMVQNPARYNLSDPDNISDNQDRRDLVLQRMLETKRITEAEYEQAIASEVTPNFTPRPSGCDIAETNYNLGHFCDYVQRTVEQDPALGETAEERHFNFLRGGFQIMTTIDLDLQAAAVASMREHVPQLMEGIDIGAAVSSVEVHTGRVLVMTQNRPFSADPDVLDAEPGYTSINYNTDETLGGSLGFQVGSTMKVFTLAEWLRKGNSLYDMVDGNARTVNFNSFRAHCLGGVYGAGSWSFRNNAGEMPGKTSVLSGTMQSLNGVFVSMQQRLDLCDTIALAEKLGVHRASVQPDEHLSNYNSTHLTITPSLAFAGTDEIAPLTMASANAAFANGGVHCTPVPIDWITGIDGEEIDFTKSKCVEAVSPDVAAGVLFALQNVANSGTGAHARSLYGVPHFIKTGTTDDVKDRWNVGGSSTVATAVWTGNVEGFVSLERTSLGRAERPLFNAVMNAADAKYGGDYFPPPPSSATQQVLRPIPAVLGLTYAEAEAVLKAAEFDIVNGGDIDSELPAGTVVKTDPEGEAGRGADITVYLSKGNLKLIPEGLIGVPGATTQAALAAVGFTDVILACSPSPPPTQPLLPSNIVESVAPAAGSPVNPTAQVWVYVTCT